MNDSWDVLEETALTSVQELEFFNFQRSRSFNVRLPNPLLFAEGERGGVSGTAVFLIINHINENS